MSIIKSTNDTRLYSGGMLNNHLKYVTVQDTSINYSHVSLTVNVGSNYDPKNFQGLAHFLEHMLFMGNEKYKHPNYFMDKLNNYGGTTNAYTTPLTTTYYFSVDTKNLEEIIDIFAYFFISPLFINDCVDKEINAVNNESIKILSNDENIIYQLLYYLTDSNNSTNTFLCGSNESLKKDKLREALIDFYDKYYTTQNMSLCIISSKSIDDMYNIIINTFNNIQIKKKGIITNHTTFIQKPFYTENSNNMYFINIYSNNYLIKIIWEIFEDVKYYKLIDFILSRKTKNSLYYHLFLQSFINDLYVDIIDQGVFYIGLNLTEKGWHNMLVVLNIVFNYLNYIKNLNIKSIEEYYKKLLKLKFDTIISSSYLHNFISENHLKYSIENIILGYYTIPSLSKEKYDSLLSIFDNNPIIIFATNKYFCTDLIKINMLYHPNRFYCKLSSSSTDLKNIINKTVLSTVNFDSYIISEFKYLQYNEQNKSYTDIAPVKVSDTIWYSSINKCVNKIILYTQFYNNKFTVTPENYILCDICIELLNIILNINYGLFIECNNNIMVEFDDINSSINIVVICNNDIEYHCDIITDIFTFMSNIKLHMNILSDDFINRYIENKVLDIKNKSFMTPFNYFHEIFTLQCCDTQYSDKILLKKIKTITILKIKKFMATLFNSSYIRHFIYGNIDSLNTDNSNKIINNTKKLSSYFNNIKNYTDRIHNIKKFLGVFTLHTNINEKAFCIGYCYNIGQYTKKKYILVLLFINIYSQIFFNTLRTKYQLGYLVKLFYKYINNNYYIVQAIQSSNPIHTVISKINDFNKNLINILNNTDIELHKNSLKSMILYNNSFSEQFSVWLNEIITDRYFFDIKLLLPIIDSITKKDCLKFIYKYIYISDVQLIIIY